MWRIRTRNDLDVLRQGKHVSSALIEIVECYFHQFEEASDTSGGEEFCLEECSMMVLDQKIDDWKKEVGFNNPLWLEYVEAIDVGEGPSVLKVVRMLDNESLVTYFVQTEIDAEVDEWLKQYAM